MIGWQERARAGRERLDDVNSMCTQSVNTHAGVHTLCRPQSVDAHNMWVNTGERHMGLSPAAGTLGKP